MISEIKKKYNNFSDSNIFSFLLTKQLIEQREILTAEIGVLCFNSGNNNEYEKIRLSFNDIILINLYEGKYMPYFSPQEVFIEENEDNIIFDFDPINDFENIKENLDSKFKIICKSVSYKPELS